MFQWQDIVWYLCVAFILLYFGARFLPIRRLKRYKAMLKRRVGKIGIIALILGAGVVSISSMNPWLTEPLWNKLPQNIQFWDQWIKDNPGAGTGHLDFNGEKKWDNIDISFTVRDGGDDVDKSVIAGTPEVRVYRGLTITDTPYYTDDSIDNGVFESENAQFMSGEILTIIIGDHDHVWDGPSALKSAVFQCVVQGQDGDTKPDFVMLGEGIFYTYYMIDGDDGMAIDWYTTGGVAWGADENIGDGAINGRLECVARITFFTADRYIESYYDSEVQHKWTDFGILMKMTWNTTGTAAIASSIGLSASGYNVIEANIGNDKAFVLQLTSGAIRTGDVRPAIGYDTASNGDELAGYAITFEINMVWDFSNCQMSDDAYMDYTLTGELFSSTNLQGVCLAGTYAEGSYEEYADIATTSCALMG